MSDFTDDTENTDPGLEEFKRRMAAETQTSHGVMPTEMEEQSFWSKAKDTYTNTLKTSVSVPLTIGDAALALGEGMTGFMGHGSIVAAGYAEEQFQKNKRDVLGNPDGAIGTDEELADARQAFTTDWSDQFTEKLGELSKVPRKYLTAAYSDDLILSESDDPGGVALTPSGKKIRSVLENVFGKVDEGIKYTKEKAVDLGVLPEKHSQAFEFVLGAVALEVAPKIGKKAIAKVAEKLAPLDVTFRKQLAAGDEKGAKKTLDEMEKKLGNDLAKADPDGTVFQRLKEMYAEEFVQGEKTKTEPATEPTQKEIPKVETSSTKITTDVEATKGTLTELDLKTIADVGKIDAGTSSRIISFSGDSMERFSPVLKNVFDDLNLPVDVVLADKVQVKRLAGISEVDKTIFGTSFNVDGLARKTFVIGVDGKLPIHDQMFSLAHEVGHVIDNVFSLSKRTEFVSAFEKSNKFKTAGNPLSLATDYGEFTKTATVNEFIANETAKWLLFGETPYKGLADSFKDISEAYKKVLADLTERDPASLPNKEIADFLKEHSEYSRMNYAKERVSAKGVNAVNDAVKDGTLKKSKYNTKSWAEEVTKVIDEYSGEKDALPANVIERVEKHAKARNVPHDKVNDLLKDVEDALNLPGFDALNGGTVKSRVGRLRVLDAALRIMGNEGFKSKLETISNALSVVFDEGKKIKHTAPETKSFSAGDVDVAEAYAAKMLRDTGKPYETITNSDGTLTTRPIHNSPELAKAPGHVQEILKRVYEDRNVTHEFMALPTPAGYTGPILYSSPRLWKFVTDAAKKSGMPLDRWLEQKLSLNAGAGKPVAGVIKKYMALSKHLVDPTHIFASGELPFQTGKMAGFVNGKGLADAPNQLKTMPVYEGELRAVQKALAGAGEYRPGKLVYNLSMAHNFLNSIGGQKLKDYLMHPMNRQKANYLREYKYMQEQVVDWAKILDLKDAEMRKIGRALYTVQEGGPERLAIMKEKPLRINELSEKEMRFVNLMEAGYKNLFERVNEARALMGQEPLTPLPGEYYHTMLTRLSENGSGSVLGGNRIVDSFRKFLSRNSTGNERFLDSILTENMADRQKAHFENIRSGVSSKNISYEMNALDAYRTYTQSALWTVYMGPLYTKYKAVLSQAYKKGVFEMAETRNRKYKKPKGKNPAEGAEGPKIATTSEMRESIRNSKEFKDFVSAGRLQELLQRFGTSDLNKMGRAKLAKLKSALEQGSRTLKKMSQNSPNKTNIRELHPAKYNMLVDYIESVFNNRTEHATKSDSIFRDFEDAAYVLTKNASAAYCLGTATTVVNQFSSLVNAGTLSTMHTPGAFMRAFIPSEVKRALKESPTLYNRITSGPEQYFADIVGPESVRTKKAKVIQVAGVPVRFTDGIVAVTSWLAGESMAKAKGLKGVDVVNFADEFLVKTQGSPDLVFAAPIQRTKVGRAMTGLQTYAIAHANLLAADVIGKASSHPAATAMHLAKYLVYGNMVNMAFRDILHMYPPYPDPAWELAMSLRDGDHITKATWEAAKATILGMPVVGGVPNFGPESALGPGLSTAATLLKGVKFPEDGMDADEFGAFLGELALSPQGRAAVATSGIPFLVQMLKTGRAYNNGDRDWRDLLFGGGATRKERPTTFEYAEELLD